MLNKTVKLQFLSKKGPGKGKVFNVLIRGDIATDVYKYVEMLEETGFIEPVGKKLPKGTVVGTVTVKHQG